LVGKGTATWWIGYAVKTVVNDAIPGNACHTWHAEEDIAESQVHLLLACRCDKSVDRRAAAPARARSLWPALTAGSGVGLLGGLIGGHRLGQTPSEPPWGIEPQTYALRVASWRSAE
jgi:hypothetical protein